MKKTVMFVAGFMLLAGSCTPVFAAAVTPKVVVSKEVQTATSAPETVSPTPTPADDYTLPYPGVLQDNPLYFLKTIRDKIMEWLIVDPIRKINFYVLQSDKDLNAGILLGLANKQSLVPSALTQSIADMEKAVTLVTSSDNSGKTVPATVIENIGRSLTKHQEVLTDFAQKAADPEKNTIESLVGKTKDLEGIIGKLK